MTSLGSAESAHEARGRTLDLIDDLDAAQMMGPKGVLNPLLWEVAHVAWFMERWVLRRDGAGCMIPNGDALYDSAAVAHETRWDLDLPSRSDSLAYMARVLEASLERVASPQCTDLDRFHLAYAVGHECMHGEAFTRTRQWHGYPPPKFRQGSKQVESGPHPGDADVPGGLFRLGAEEDAPFVFDNEKWAHPVEVAPFRIARAPVTQAEFAAFVDDNGYSRAELWTAGRYGKTHHPVYWRRTECGWERRDFDRWVSLEPNRPVSHVSWYEANAWCRWAGRRLPTEAEWEMAASLDPTTGIKRLYPWGDQVPEPRHANFDWATLACVDVGCHADGDSAVGCRQMLGNVWEWTSSVFGPFPGFVPDPYADYSQPWFGDHYVLKGGAWAGRSRLHRNTYRKYHGPHRRDVFAGFRTVACE